MSYSGPLRRVVATNKMNAKKKLLAGKVTNNSRSATTQQAIRTGGWANPASGTELKFADKGFVNNIAGSVLTFVPPVQIGIIGPGTGPSDRIGRKLTVTKIYLRWAWAMAAGATGGSPCRVIVFYDKQANGVAPAITDLLLSDGFSSANNLTYRDRFVVLMDLLTPSISSSLTPWAVAGSEVKNTSLEVVYNTGTDGLVGSIASGSLWIMTAQCNGIASAGTAATFTCSARVRYRDA